MFTLLIFLLLLSVLVIAHELGHFWAARRSGMTVEEFGVGFPPRLWAWKDRRGTEWSINLIPLGGFVRIFGENGEERGQPGSFTSKPAWARFAVLIGGVVMNILVAWALFSAGFAIGMPAMIGENAPAGAVIENPAILVMEVLPESPAARAGVVPGDTLTRVGEQAVVDAENARTLLAAAGTNEIAVQFSRGDVVLEVTVRPEILPGHEQPLLGIAFADIGTVRLPWWRAPLAGARVTVDATIGVVRAFGQLIAGAARRDDVVASLSGPVGIAVMAGDIARLGGAHLLQFAAMLSVNLAVVNAIPFPALDGGRIALLVIEVIRRKPNSRRWEQGVHAAGFALLLLLVVFVTYHDILRLW